MKLLLGIGLTLALALMGRATTVQPPSFDELTDGSAVIFRGRVTDVQNVWSGEGPKAHLATRVTFEIDRALKGECPATLTLEFMGGERGAQRLEISGLPKFKVGERGIYFVENRNGRLCPLTRLRHGRYRIVADATGQSERVARDDYSPLREPAAVREPLAEARVAASATTEAGLTLAEFESAILGRAQNPAPRQPVSR